jgi:alkylation response protein AidB-like acyl-CoA dehydrogenase
MYPLLRDDDERRHWIDQTATTLARFAADHRAEIDAANRDSVFPRELYREFGAMGYLGPTVPTEWGGLGGGVPEYAVISEEVGRHGLVSGQIAVQGAQWLMDWGSDEQKEQWLRGIATGEMVFSESISEKDAGSSFKALQASAVRAGSDWIINGAKTHVNLGADCDVTLVYAVAEEGLTSFLVDMTLDGIATKVTNPVGLRLIRTADVSFDDVRVPESACLGGPGEGLKTFLSTFNVSRLGYASELIGLGRRALDLAVDYAEQRQVGDDLVTDFQGIRWMIADSWSDLTAAALARDNAAMAHERGRDIAVETTLAKRLAIDSAENAVSTAFSMVGGHGLYFSEPYVDILNDVKVLKVAGGSSEVLRNFLAHRILTGPGREGLS